MSNDHHLKPLICSTNYVNISDKKPDGYATYPDIHSMRACGQLLGHALAEREGRAIARHRSIPVQTGPGVEIESAMQQPVGHLCGDEADRDSLVEKARQGRWLGLRDLRRWADWLPGPWALALGAVSVKAAMAVAVSERVIAVVPSDLAKPSCHDACMAL